MRALMIVVSMLLSASVAAESDAFRESVLKGYDARCHQALGQRGIAPAVIDRVCSCEVGVIDRNFSDFLRVLRPNEQATGRGPVSEEEKQTLRAKVRACKDI